MRFFLTLALLFFSASAFCAEIVFPSEWVLAYFPFGVVCGLVVIYGLRG